MANFVFYAARDKKDASGKDLCPAVECSATVPAKDALGAYPGGKINIRTPAGNVEIVLPSGADMAVAHMKVLLQNAGRDKVYPLSALPKKNGKKQDGYK